MKIYVGKTEKIMKNMHKKFLFGLCYNIRHKVILYFIPEFQMTTWYIYF